MYLEIVLDPHVGLHFDTLLKEYHDNIDWVASSALEVLWVINRNDHCLAKQIFLNRMNQDTVVEITRKCKKPPVNKLRLKLQVSKGCEVFLSELMRSHGATAEEVFVTAFTSFAILHQMSTYVPTEYFVNDEFFNTVEELLDLPPCLH